MKNKEQKESPLIQAALDYLWWGVSIGGRHYTGHIRVNDTRPRHELERKLSRKEAKLYHEEMGLLWNPLPMITNKFETFEDISKHAVKWCEDNLGDNWILFEYDYGNPYRVLGAKGWIEERVKYLNELAIMWEGVENRHRTSEVMKTVYDTFNFLMKKPE